MKAILNALGKFFGVFLRGQTYLNTLFLLISFPLGIFYFVVLVTGFSLGFSLLIILWGLLILAGMVAAWYGLAILERLQAIWLLRVPVPPMSRPVSDQATATERIRAHLTNRVTWSSLLYLFLKFPIGIFNFVVLTVLGTLVLVLITAPVTYRLFPLQVWFTDTIYWQLDTLWEALLAFPFGVLLGLISMHVINLLAWVQGWLARVMLGISQGTSQPAYQAAPAAGQALAGQVQPAPVSFVVPDLPAADPAAPTMEEGSLPVEAPDSAEQESIQEAEAPAPQMPAPAGEPLQVEEPAPTLFSAQPVPPALPVEAEEPASSPEEAPAEHLENPEQAEGQL